MINFGVTLLSTKTPLIAAGSPTAYASFLVIQNNSGATLNFGGAAGVSATRGITISTGSPGGSSSMQFNFPRGCCLNNVYLFGTVGDVVDVCYEPSE